MKPYQKPYTLFLLLLLFACEVEENPEPVSIFFRGASTEVATLTSNASSPYTITANGRLDTWVAGSTYELGFCYSTTANPDESDNCAVAFEGVPTNANSSFSAELTQLSSNTRYYIKAYAKDSQNRYFFGNDVTVTTPRPEAPTANFSFSPISPFVGDEITFTNQSSNATSYEWNFGDGTSSTLENPTHTFSQPGTYTIKLTVANPDGQTAEVSKTVQLRLPPNAVSAEQLTGEWVGTYICNQGITGTILEIEGSGTSINAVFTFFATPENVDVPIGIYELSGTVDVNRNIRLNAGNWILQPNNFITLDLEGVVNSAANQITGKLIGTNCSDLKLTKRTTPIDAKDIEGNWSGVYSCGQGETNLTLSITGSGKNVNAVFAFSATTSNPNVPSGSYRMVGIYNGDGVLDLDATEWINRPAGFGTVEMSMEVNLSGQDFLRGFFKDNVPCNDGFRLTRSQGFTPIVYANASYTSIFSENFSNNNLGWFEDNDNTSRFEVSGGVYTIESKNDRNWGISLIQEIDQSRNFEIEVELKLVQGGEDFGHSIRWGASDIRNNYFFSLLPDQRFSIGDVRNGNFTFWKEWTNLPDLITVRDWNKLTIRKYENEFYFFINEQFVYSHRFESFKGDRIYFVVPSRAVMEVDNLRVNYIND